MNSRAPITVDYFTDVLCVWAWIAQPRLRELQQEWGERIQIRQRFVDVFGDAVNKITAKWGASDGFEQFSSHVRHVASAYRDSPVSDGLWRSVRPRSSLPAHLVLRGTHLVAGELAADRLAAAIREAFFVDTRDIGRLDELLALVREQGLDSDAVSDVLETGEAMAALSRDQRLAQDAGVRGSPTWVLNEGRQVLYGNVGYRILNANLEELLRQPAEERSWC